VIHRLPWKAPKGIYSDAGPKKDIEFEVAGVVFQVRLTGLKGIDTDRARYLVACVDCDCVLHDCTTGPRFHISGHLSERHGFKGEIEYAEERRHRALVDRKTSEVL